MIKAITKNLSIVTIFNGLFFIKIAHADILDITNNSSQNVSTITTSNNIINLNFNSSLIINSSSNQDQVNAVFNNSGNILFDSENIFTINNIGSSGNIINNINFASNGTLKLNSVSANYPNNNISAIYSANGISSNSNGLGNLQISGAIPYLSGSDSDFAPINYSHIIDSSIGSFQNKINNINIDSDNAKIEFKKSVFAKNLNFDGNLASYTNTQGDKYKIYDLKISDNFMVENTTIDNSVITISGESKTLNFGDLNINASSNSFSQLYLSSKQSLNIDNLTFDSITNNENKYLTLDADSNVYISKNISGNGSIDGGNIIFNGSVVQNSGSNIKIGSADSFVEKIAIQNNSSVGVVFNGDMFTKNLDFSAGNDLSKIKLSSTSNMTLSGNIYSNAKNNGAIYGEGKLILSGVDSKIINSKIGLSTANKLTNLEIDLLATGQKITLNNSNYLTNLKIKSATTLENSGYLEVDNLSIEENSKLKINGDNKINNLNISSNKNLELIGNADLKIAGNISGVGANSIFGSANQTGSIAFIGSQSQEVPANLQIGKDDFYLAKISSQNISADGVKFLNDVKVKDLEFKNSSGEANINIAMTKSIFLAGDISQKSKNSSAIIGDGNLQMVGSSMQIIDTKIGKDSSNRLDTMIINNDYGVYFKQNSFLKNLTINKGFLTLDDSVNLDILNSVNLSGKTLITNVLNGQYGKIISDGGITFDNTTKIKFDYSKYSGANLDMSGQTTYDILVSSSLNGDVDKIIIEDNSLLYDNKISKNSNKIVTNLAKSSQFQESVLGKEKYNSLQGLVDLKNNKINDGILSIQTNSQLDNALNSIKPIENNMIYNQLISHIDNLFDIAIANDNDLINSNNTKIDHEDLRIKSLNKKTPQIEAKNSKNIQPLLIKVNYNPNEDDIFAPKILNEDPPQLKNYSLWWKLLGNHFTQKVSENNNDYNGKTSGLMIGLNKKIDLKNYFLTIGSAVSSSMININNNRNKNLDINSYQLLFYQGIYNKSGEGFFNNNMLLIAHNNHDINRTIEIGNYKNSFKSSYGGKMFSVESKIGFKKDFFNKKFNISPLIGLQYLAINNDDYLEKQDDLVIKYKNQFYHQAIAKIGLEFDSKIKTDNYIFSPNFMFSYNRNLLNNSVNDSYNIANAGSGNSINNSSLNKIAVNSKILQINKFNVATGLNIFAKNHESVRVKYQLQTAKNFINHSGFVEYKKEF